MAGSAGRKHLLGILKFANEIRTWTVKIINDATELTEDLLASDISGFIGEVTQKALSQLQKRDIPSVVFEAPTDELLQSNIHTLFMTDDDEQIGRLGAKYLLSLGKFASFAFLPGKDGRAWSRSRQAGFERHLTESGLADSLHHPPEGGIGEWLIKLPKPAAILADHDFRAKEVIDACINAKIDVPKQVAVLGIDNDELICDYTQPTLSSVKIDHEDFGYCAANALWKLLSRGARRNHKSYILHSADCVMERESTRPIPPITYLVNKIHTFIRNHAREPITINDIIRHAGVSRRIADLRMKEATGKTIHETLLDIRLSFVANHLKKSRLPINKLSILSGFRNVQRLKYIFKSRYGMSMREFREQNSQMSNLNNLSL